MVWLPSNSCPFQLASVEEECESSPSSSHRLANQLISCNCAACRQQTRGHRSESGSCTNGRLLLKLHLSPKFIQIALSLQPFYPCAGLRSGAKQKVKTVKNADRWQGSEEKHAKQLCNWAASFESKKRRKKMRTGSAPARALPLHSFVPLAGKAASSKGYVPPCITLKRMATKQEQQQHTHTATKKGKRNCKTAADAVLLQSAREC